MGFGCGAMEDLVSMYSGVYRDKKVLITGNSGFKGSWLTVWLLQLGATVVGYSMDVPSSPSMFNELDLSSRISHYFGDVRDLDELKKVIISERPDFIFHLAAQAIVSESYKNPIETFGSNVLGTMNVLEVLRGVDFPCIAILITSDKCYDNVEWVWGYKETDEIGGKDIYSGSKGAAELVIKSYLHSFFNKEDGRVLIGIGRAGNVIGGGDWAKDRIISDAMRAWSAGIAVEIRSPNSTRPWQHVLEPLSGYLVLGKKLFENRRLHGEAFNFGPKSEQNKTVKELLDSLFKSWQIQGLSSGFKVAPGDQFKESALLKLNCDKAQNWLDWLPILEYEEAIHFVGDWYQNFYMKKTDMFSFTVEQIIQYKELAKKSQASWSRD